MNIQSLFAFVTLVFLPAICTAQNVSYETWVTGRISAARTKVESLREQADAVAISANSNRAIRQREAPSADSRSTSLVDQSSATDFLNVAVAMAPSALGSPGNGNGGSGTVTATVYSVLALLNKVSLTDPQFYKNHVAARQVSFTLGSTASDAVRDNTVKPGTTVGLKFTLWNEREIYTKRNQMLIRNLQDQLSITAPVETALKASIAVVLFCEATPGGVPGVSAAAFASLCQSRDINRVTETALAVAFGTFIAKPFAPSSLSENTLRLVDALIAEKAMTLAALQTAIHSAYDQISKGRQLGLTATYVDRPELGTDDFRSALVFDYGLAPRINWTVNGSFDYRNRRAAGDQRGGRFATEFLGRITGYGDGLWGMQPITLAFAGEGRWLSTLKPQYAAQAKLTIPISGGLNLPVIYRWSKGIDLVDAQGKELRVGLTVDLGALSANLMKK